MQGAIMFETEIHERSYYYQDVELRADGTRLFGSSRLLSPNEAADINHAARSSNRRYLPVEYPSGMTPTGPSKRIR